MGETVSVLDIATEHTHEAKRTYEAWPRTDGVFAVQVASSSSRVLYGWSSETAVAARRRFARNSVPHNIIHAKKKYRDNQPPLGNIVFFLHVRLLIIPQPCGLARRWQTRPVTATWPTQPQCETRKKPRIKLSELSSASSGHSHSHHFVF